jgi:hypothetical protein
MHELQWKAKNFQKAWKGHCMTLEEDTPQDGGMGSEFLECIFIKVPEMLSIQSPLESY